MGVQTIIELIQREAQEEAAGIVADAERVAADLVMQAEATLAARVSEVLDREGRAIRAESHRRINAVRLSLLEQRAKLDAERLAAVFEAADARSQSIADGGDGPRWAAALATLCEDALGSAGQGARVFVRRRDAASLAQLASDRNFGIETTDDDAPAGVVVCSADGRIEIDSSLAARTARARIVLAEWVAETLALHPGDVVADPGSATGQGGA